jgi:hypothetical protein
MVDTNRHSALLTVDAAIDRLPRGKYTAICGEGRRALKVTNKQ